MASKYVPAREDGLKPFVCEVAEWGKSWTRLEWAPTAAQARFQAKARARYRYVTGVRRATPDDLPKPPDAVSHHAGCALLTERGISHDSDDPYQRCDCRCHETST